MVETIGYVIGLLYHLKKATLSSYEQRLTLYKLVNNTRYEVLKNESKFSLKRKICSMAFLVFLRNLVCCIVIVS